MLEGRLRVASAPWYGHGFLSPKPTPQQHHQPAAADELSSMFDPRCGNITPRQHRKGLNASPRYQSSGMPSQCKDLPIQPSDIVHTCHKCTRYMHIYQRRYSICQRDWYAHIEIVFLLGSVFFTLLAITVKGGGIPSCTIGSLFFYFSSTLLYLLRPVI